MSADFLDRLPFFATKHSVEKCFSHLFSYANHISQNFSIFFSLCDFCNKYHIFGKDNSSNDKVIVCRSKKEVSADIWMTPMWMTLNNKH